jgi:oligoendopeptidase F
MAVQEQVKERIEVKKEDRWNVESLYPSWSEWEADFFKWARPNQSIRWPELDNKKFDVTKAADLKNLFDVILELDRMLSKLYTYAHLRHDEDVAEDKAKKSYISATCVLHTFREEISWVEPAILQLSEEKLLSLLQDRQLASYAIYLEKIIRMKPYTLSAQEEKLMAYAGKALESAQRTFGAMNNADLKFPVIQDQSGEKKELTHGTYLLYLRGRDRTLRKEAFVHLHNTFQNYENTFCELLQGQIQKHLFEAKARGYDSCLQAALYPHQIDPSVYLSLIETVRKRVPFLHKYLAIRKKLLGYEDLHFYDLQVSIVKQVDMSMSYQEAEKAVISSVSVLGSEYQNILQKGLSDERWVDRYENKRKRSGAYSSGCYDSSPYILMNYHGTLQDVMTLSHEAGHSMHTYYSCKNQPYHYSQYPIFLAEVASTFHEELLFHYFLGKAKTREEKAYLINQKIDDIRSTLFRQTMFAEFELTLHEWIEKGVPLTPSLLREQYKKLNREYYGPELCIDEEIAIEWARIPHFYYNFYVYQYATGISAAHALLEGVLKEGEPARKRYLGFLSAGSSQYPLDVLSDAGVDMRKPGPVDSLLCYFNQLAAELETLLR